MRSRGGLSMAASAVVGVLALSCLCSCQTTAASSPLPTPVKPAASAPAVSASPLTPAAAVTVTPADGATAVALGSQVSVAVAHGSLTTVSVTDPDGATVDGALDSSGTSWTTTGDLFPATHYLVTATAVDAAGNSTDQSTSFTTVAAKNVLTAKIAPLAGEVVGVGMPIIVYFNTSVTNKAAVEKALTLDMSVPVQGAWHWYGSKEVHYRPMQYWPTGEQVTLHANLKGVDAGKGLWGLDSRDVAFTVGDSHIADVDAATHTMTVYVNGALAKTMAVSTGRDKYPTTSGTHVILEKSPSVIMDSATVGIPKGNPDYYYETVLWDVRISWSGEFVHAAPWSVASQGRENVSHGCVNADAADAQWFYTLSRRGDIVTVTGTPRPLTSGNGWTDWDLDWDQWLAGSAIYGTGNYIAPTPTPGDFGSVALPAAKAVAVKPTPTPTKPVVTPSATAPPTATPTNTATATPTAPASSPVSPVATATS